MKQDLETILDEGNQKGIFKSESSKVREVWGLVKKLRMSEANLDRRVREYESSSNSQTVSEQIVDLRNRYE